MAAALPARAARSAASSSASTANSGARSPPAMPPPKRGARPWGAGVPPRSSPPSPQRSPLPPVPPPRSQRREGGGSAPAQPGPAFSVAVAGAGAAESESRAVPRVFRNGPCFGARGALTFISVVFFPSSCLGHIASLPVLRARPSAGPGLPRLSAHRGTTQVFPPSAAAHRFHSLLYRRVTPAGRSHRAVCTPECSVVCRRK